MIIAPIEKVKKEIDSNHAILVYELKLIMKCPHPSKNYVPRNNQEGNLTILE
jgi:hypothetical protein